MSRREASATASVGPCRRVLGACVLAWGGVSGAWALERGVTPQGHAYLVGGIGEDEQRAIALAKPDFNLWLLTAARRSGAYLAGVHMRVTGQAGQPVFDGVLDGPYLLLALPSGSYEVQARYADGPWAPPQRQRAKLGVPPTGRQQLVLYFDAADQAVTP